MERFFEQIIENSLNEIYIFDTNTYRFIYINKAALSNLGYSMKEMQNMTPLDIKPEMDLEKFKILIKPLTENKEQKIVFHTKHLRKDGTTYRVMVSLQKMKIEKEVFVAFIYDETELYREKERFFKMFQGHMAVMLLIHPETGNIINANSAAEKFYGLSIEVLKKMKIQEINTLTESEVYEEMQRAKRQNNMYFRFKHRTASSEIKDVEVYSCPIEVDGKTILYSIVHDVSEKMKLLDLLQKAQKMEAVGTLAAGIAHDFNNLLTGIYGYIGLINEIAQNDEAKKYLLEVEKSIDRAKGLTSQLLTFTKGGAPVKELCDMKKFLMETVNFALAGSGITAMFDIDENLMNAEIDKYQMWQAIDNIIINARDAMPEGGKIYVSAKNIDFEDNDFSSLVKGNYVKIIVKDEGHGIPQNIMDKIFDPFFTTKSKGHGLGLASVFSIIKKHNGMIDVKSEENKGTEFSIYLPGKSERITEKTNFAIQTSNNHKKLRVLVLDDEDMLRNLLSDILKNMGMYVETAVTGEDAIDIFVKNRETNPFDLLIFDLIIPGGMGGVEAIKEIRKIDKGVIAFVTSGYSHDPALAEPEKFGFNGSIPKPFKVKDIKNIVDNAFE